MKKDNFRSNALNAKAASLEELLSQQTVETIESVTFHGKGIMASEGIAASICLSLGFTRLVSSESKRCEDGESVFSMYRPDNKNGRGARLQWVTRCEGLDRKFESIKCAR